MIKKILLVFTTNAEKFIRREELIKINTVSGKEVKYSDYAVEVKEGDNITVYKLAVLPVDSVFGIMNALRKLKDETDCSEIEMISLVKGLDVLIADIKRFRDGLTPADKREISGISGSQIKDLPPSANQTAAGTNTGPNNENKEVK